ncbi:MAG: hypothetical protein D3920_07945 [Candidatus Electrothrix sp. AW2]|nr:hypothetical protein [Candidatus Electrothrix gigas]
MKLHSEDIQFMVTIMNCLISRQPFILQPPKGSAEMDLKYLLSLLPSHRRLLVAGKIPEWVRRLSSRPRELPTENLSELRECVQEALEEERTGSRPVQFVFFSINKNAYERLLKSVPTGWIATVEDFESENFREVVPDDAVIHKNSEGGAILYFGTQRSTDFEQSFFKRTGGRSKLSVSFLVQKKFAELYLAAASIVGDLERFTELLTIPELETFFEMDSLTVGRLFDLIQADYGLDIRPYALLPSDDALAKVKDLLNLPHLIAIGVVSKGCLVHLHRLRIVAGLNIHGIIKHIGKTYEEACTLPLCTKKPGVLMFPDGHIVIVAHHVDNVYITLMTKEAKYNVAIESIAGVLKSKDRE